MNETKNSYRFFQNRECQYFPCHSGVPEPEFNCLFCFCPLYPLGKQCGGNCFYTENGTKSCMNCAYPHFSGNYEQIISRFDEIRAVVRQSDERSDGNPQCGKYRRPAPDMKLIEPTMAYSEQIRAYRQEFLDSGDSMDGTGGLRDFDDPQDWIAFLEKHRNPKTVPEGRVPATQLIFVREEDNKIVGMLDIRHSLSEYLRKFGGHIGYSVAPGERRKGYATQMLKAALPICRQLGIDKVLITCMKGNEGSKRTILHNGGIYESTVYEPDEKIELEKYWITL